MTDPDTTDGQPLSAEGAELLAEHTAAQIEASPNPAGDAAATAAAMSERGPTLPAEADIDKFMAEMKAKFESMSAELATLKAQQHEALAAAGGPMVTRYAQGAADKIAALVAAHPDAPVNHFGPAVASAGKLAEAAAGLAKGSGTVSVLQGAEQDLARFLGRTHWRAWGKHIDFSAILDDAATAVEEGLKLAAAA